MKAKILIIFTLLLAFIIMPVSITFAQEQEQSNSIVFGGMNYDEVPVIVTGIGVNLPGTKIWTFNYINVGEYGSFNSELGLLFGNDKLYFGPIAGPNVEWIEPSSEIEMINYFTGAGGLIAGFKFSENFGIWSYAKYKFDFKKEDNSMYVDGVAYGIGLYIPLLL